MCSRLSTREKWFLGTALLGGIVALGGVYVGTQAIEAEEKAYSIAAEKSADLKAAKSLAVELQRRLDKAENRQSPAAGAPGTLAAANRNPFNVKGLGNGQKWRGETGRDSKGHVVFDTIEHGIRAGAFTLVSYYGKHGIDTIEGVIDRFCESNKAEYADFVARHMGMKPDEKFNILSRLPELMRTMTAFENGRAWLPMRLFVGYDVAASAYAKGKESRPKATIVATAAPKPQPKPAVQQKAQPKPQKAAQPKPQQKATANNEKQKATAHAAPKPRMVAGK